MYLSGSKGILTRRRGRRGSPWRILILLALIGVTLYVNQVVVPATPPLFIPTPTATRAPESFVNEADQLYNDGKLAQAIDVYRQAAATDPDNPSLYISMAKAQIYTSQYEAALESAERALILNNNNPIAHAIKAWALDFQGDYTQAEATVKRALELDANNAFAHAIYAEILIDKANAGPARCAKSVFGRSPCASTLFHAEITLPATAFSRGAAVMVPSSPRTPS